MYIEIIQCTDYKYFFLKGKIMETRYEFIHPVARGYVLRFKSLNYLQFLRLIAEIEGAQK